MAQHEVGLSAKKHCCLPSIIAIYGRKASYNFYIYLYGRICRRFGRTSPPFWFLGLTNCGRKITPNGLARLSFVYLQNSRRCQTWRFLTGNAFGVFRKKLARKVSDFPGLFSFAKHFGEFSFECLQIWPEIWLDGCFLALLVLGKSQFSQRLFVLESAIDGNVGNQCKHFLAGRWLCFSDILRSGEKENKCDMNPHAFPHLLGFVALFAFSWDPPRSGETVKSKSAEIARWIHHVLRINGHQVTIWHSYLMDGATPWWSRQNPEGHEVLKRWVSLCIFFSG